MRPETGPMRFGDDWTGVFIRGDNAAWYAQKLREMLTSAAPAAYFDDAIRVAALEGLLAILEGSNETFCEQQREIEDLQQMKEYDKCVQS